MGVLATLGAVCLLEVTEPIGDNYNFRENICRGEMLPAKELADCGFLKFVFELPRDEQYSLAPPDVLREMREFYERCCKEA